MKSGKTVISTNKAEHSYVMKKIMPEPGKLEFYFPDSLQDPSILWSISDDPLESMNKKKFILNKL